jgi:hypothetical protein
MPSTILTAKSELKSEFQLNLIIEVCVASHDYHGSKLHVCARPESRISGQTGPVLSSVRWKYYGGELQFSG